VVHKELTDDERLTAIGLFAEAFGGLSARFAAQLAEHQLAPVEFEVLLRLSRSPGGQLRMTDLSTQTGITTGSSTGSNGTAWSAARRVPVTAAARTR